MKKVVMEIYTVEMIETLKTMAKRKGCKEMSLEVRMKENEERTYPVPVLVMEFKTECIARNMLEKIKTMGFETRIIKLEH